LGFLGSLKSPTNALQSSFDAFACLSQVIAGWPRILEITPSTLDGGHVQLDLTREIGEPTEGPRDARTLEMENEALRLKLATLERRGGR
jgi:hypothetical protein